MKVEVGKTYKLASDPALGDYAGSVVDIVKGPRSPNTPDEQYCVSWGVGAHEIDWIGTSMFTGAKEVENGTRF